MNLGRLLTLPLIAASLCAQAPRISGAAHMAYYVSDMDRARSWYKDFLGFEEAVTLKDSIYIKINDRQYIKLYAGPAANHGFLHDAGFETQEAAAARAALAAAGAKVSAVAKDEAGDLAFDVTDPFGFTIQVVQYQPNSRTTAGRGKYMPETRIGAKIDHLGILINDKEAALKFYTEVMGFAGEGDNSKLRIAGGPDRFELGFERRPPTVDRFHVKDHICLSVPDVPKIAAMLQAKPAAKTFREIETHVLGNGKHVAELYDPDGNRVELMEPPKEN